MVSEGLVRPAVRVRVERSNEHGYSQVMRARQLRIRGARFLWVALAVCLSCAAERGLQAAATSVEIPDTWRTQLDEPRGSGHVRAYEIPFAATESTPHIAQCVVASSRNANRVSVTDYARQLLSDEVAQPGFFILAASADSTACVTVLSTGGDKGARYAVIDRFSSSPEWLARVRIAFPLLNHAPSSWYDRAVPEFNSVLASFNNCGRSFDASALLLSGGILGLVSARQGAVLRAIDDPVLKSPFPEGSQGLVVYTRPTPAADR